MTAMGRTATGGITLQDKATGDTTMRHNDGDERHNDNSDGAAAADNDVDDDDKDVNNVNVDNLPPRVGKRNDGSDEMKTEEEETVADSVAIHSTIKQIMGRGGGRWRGCTATCGTTTATGGRTTATDGSTATARGNRATGGTTTAMGDTARRHDDGNVRQRAARQRQRAAGQQAAQQWRWAARQLQNLLFLHPGQVDLQVLPWGACCSRVKTCRTLSIINQLF